MHRHAARREPWLPGDILDSIAGQGGGGVLDPLAILVGRHADGAGPQDGRVLTLELIRKEHVPARELCEGRGAVALEMVQVQGRRNSVRLGRYTEDAWTDRHQGTAAELIL